MFVKITVENICVVRLQLQTIMDIMDDIMGVVEKHIEAHKKTFDGNNIRDFVDLHIEKELEGHTDDENLLTRDFLFQFFGEIILNKLKIGYFLVLIRISKQ